MGLTIFFSTEIGKLWRLFTLDGHLVGFVESPGIFKGVGDVRGLASLLVIFWIVEPTV